MLVMSLNKEPSWSKNFNNPSSKDLTVSVYLSRDLFSVPDNLKILTCDQAESYISKFSWPF